MSLSAQQEKFARSFFENLLGKGHYDRARSFCARDELSEELRTELLAAIEARQEEERRARREAHDAVEQEDQRLYGELRGLLEADAFDEADLVRRRLTNPGLRQSATQLLGERRENFDDRLEARIKGLIEAHEWVDVKALLGRFGAEGRATEMSRALSEAARLRRASLREEFAPYRLLALSGGGVLIDDQGAKGVCDVLSAHAKTWEQDATRRLMHFELLRSVEGAGERLLRRPTSIGEVLDPFEDAPLIVTGRGRYSWWEPDWRPNVEAAICQKIADSVEVVSLEALETRAFDQFLDELGRIAADGADFVPDDFEALVRWLREGGERPVLSSRWDWSEAEQQGRAWLDAMAIYARAVITVDERLCAFFEGKAVTRFNLVPEENENYAWVFEALVGPQGVAILGYFYDL